MADLMGLVKALKDKAMAQYGKGAPYREALASALRGDTQGINQALSKSDLTPMDFATTFAPLGITTWHGSPIKDLTELNPKKSFGRLGVSWVSPSEDFAKNYAGKEGKVYQVELNEGKNFDFSNQQHLDELKNAAKNIEYYDPIRGFTTLDKRVPDSSSYYSAEDPMLFDLIKNMGNDTVSVMENGVKNIGVFNPKKNAKIINN